MTEPGMEKVENNETPKNERIGKLYCRNAAKATCSFKIGIKPLRAQTVRLPSNRHKARAIHAIIAPMQYFCGHGRRQSIDSGRHGTTTPCAVTPGTEYPHLHMFAKLNRGEKETSKLSSKNLIRRICSVRHEKLWILAGLWVHREAS